MVSTKITSSDVLEIENKLKNFTGDMVRIEYLENCIKKMVPNDAARFCHIKLAELYAYRLMWQPAAKNMEMAAETAVTFKDKLEFYLKEISYLIKINDYLKIDNAFKKAILCANTNQEKEAIKQQLKQELLNQAKEYEKKNQRSKAAAIYEKLMDMPIINTEERKQLMEKSASLNSGLGRLKEAMRYEQMLKRPIEPHPSHKKSHEEDVKKVSFEDLGIQGL